MSGFDILLIAATVLCSLVAGFLFAFAAVVMPGLRALDDRAFLRGFQVIDGVIQRNSPAFLGVWVGSALSLVSATALGFGTLPTPAAWLLVAACATYLAGVQAPTILINIPLNNALQRHALDAMDADQLRAARLAFEPRWNTANRARTGVACAVALALCCLLLAR